MERVRRAALLIGAPLLAVAALVALSVPLFVSPAVDEIGEAVAGADAVVVLGGGAQTRLDRSLDVLEAAGGPAPALVVTVPYGPPLEECGNPAGLPQVEVVCNVPEPFTTSGEAAFAARLAAERGWDRLVVVTSDYHVTRSRHLFDQCADLLAPDAELAWVAAESDPTTLRGAWLVTQEWPSLLAVPFDHVDACRGSR